MSRMSAQRLKPQFSVTVYWIRQFLSFHYFRLLRNFARNDY